MAALIRKVGCTNGRITSRDIRRGGLSYRMAYYLITGKNKQKLFAEKLFFSFFINDYKHIWYLKCWKCIKSNFASHFKILHLRSEDGVIGISVALILKNFLITFPKRREECNFWQILISETKQRWLILVAAQSAYTEPSSTRKTNPVTLLSAMAEEPK